MNVSAAQSSAQSYGAISPAAMAARYSRSVDGAALADKALNLSRGPGDVAALYEGAREAAQTPGSNEFLTMLASLLKQGVVGTEELEVRGQRYTSFADTRIAAPNDIRNARPYRQLDLRA